MTRHAATIALKPEFKEAYLKEHADVWPEVNVRMSDSNIRNFTIFMRPFPDGTDYLFMYFEYVGSDYDADMQAIADDPITQNWWALVKPYQERFSTVSEEEWWAPMMEVCHHP